MGFQLRSSNPTLGRCWRRRLEWRRPVSGVTGSRKNRLAAARRYRRWGAERRFFHAANREVPVESSAPATTNRLFKRIRNHFGVSTSREPGAQRRKTLSAD